MVYQKILIISEITGDPVPEIEKKVGVSRGYFKKARNITAKTVIKVCEAYKVNADWFLDISTALPFSLREKSIETKKAEIARLTEELKELEG